MKTNKQHSIHTVFIKHDEYIFKQRKTQKDAMHFHPHSDCM